GIHERGRERNAQDRAGTHGEVQIQCAAGPGGRPAGGGRLAVRGAEGMSGAVRCAIYTRLSKEDGDRQGDASESIRNQKALLTAYAADRGWEVFQIYCDEDYSGADRLRPG